MGGGDLPLLLFFFALIALSLYALLLVPLEIRISGAYENGAGRGFCIVRWAAVSVRLKMEETPVVEAAIGRTVLYSGPVGRGEEEVEKGPEEEKATGPGAAETLGIVRAILPGLLDLLEYIAGRCRIGCARIRFRAGLDDAADTGTLFGIVQAIDGVLTPTPLAIAMDPLFDGGEFAVKAEGVLRIERPLSVLIAAALFAISPLVREKVWPLMGGEP